MVSATSLVQSRDVLWNSSEGVLADSVLFFTTQDGGRAELMNPNEWIGLAVGTDSTVLGFSGLTNRPKWLVSGDVQSKDSRVI